MMRRIIAGITVITAILWTGFISFATDEQPELIKGYATAYNGPTEYTCTGDHVRKGICGGCEAYLGKTIILYQRLPGDEIGDIIGYYECLDTGSGTDAFREGRLIDVWCEDLDACQDFMNLIYENGCQGHVFIQVLEADG